MAGLIAGLLSMIAMAIAVAQAPLAFDVASIKLNSSGSPREGVQQLPDGFTSTNRTLLSLISMAYQAPPFELSGGPPWLSSERFDIVAKAKRRVSMDERREMIRTLLEDRFKLRIRRETREGRVFALRLARKDGRPGEKLRLTKSDCDAVNAASARGEAVLGSPFQPVCSASGGLGLLRGNGVDMRSFATTLSALMSETIVDRTGLTGRFDFELRSSGNVPGSTAPADADAPPTIFTALQDQLGLRLEPERGPVEMFIIESVVRPTPD